MPSNSENYFPDGDIHILYVGQVLPRDMHWSRLWKPKVVFVGRFLWCSPDRKLNIFSGLFFLNTAETKRPTDFCSGGSDLQPATKKNCPNQTDIVGEKPENRPSYFIFCKIAVDNPGRHMIPHTFAVDAFYVLYF